MHQHNCLTYVFVQFSLGGDRYDLRKTWGDIETRRRYTLHGLGGFGLRL